MKSRKHLKRFAIVLFITLCGFVYFYRAGGKEPVIEVAEKPVVVEMPVVSEKPDEGKASDDKSGPSEVPAFSEKPGKKPENDLVNINTADISELCTLTGIGEVKAKKIIDYRNEKGPFKDIGDIMNISGIKEGTFNKIKDRITV